MKSLATIARIAVLIAVVLALLAGGYRWGYLTGIRKSVDPAGGTSRPDDPSSAFRIHGDSMAPTLLDGQVCRVRSLRKPLAIGDVVALTWQGAQRVKRIAALAGDRISTHDGRLLVNGTRLEDHIDARPDRQFLAPGLVAVAGRREHWHRHETDPRWLVFGYRNPHAGNRPTEVMDDYPINTDIRRQLNPVDRLVVQLASRPADSAAKLPQDLRVAFHSPDTVTQSLATPTSESERTSAIEFQFASRRASEPVRLNLSPSTPFAIHLTPSQAAQWEISVWREIEYRVSDKSESRFPITVPEAHVFVVGDNVPVSVDSRTVGPIAVSKVIGRVLPTPRPTNPSSLDRL